MNLYQSQSQEFKDSISRTMLDKEDLSQDKIKVFIISIRQIFLIDLHNHKTLY